MNILANELRLGNYIELKFTDEVIQKSLGDKFSVEQINYHHIKDLCVNDESVIYKPIPLTEEWLLNFGFIKDEYQAKECGEDVGDLFSFKKIYICKKENDFFHYIEIDSDEFYSFCSTLIINIHDLQNLYFAITRVELTLKNS